MLFNRELSDSRSDDNGKRKSVESLSSQRNVRLSLRPFDDSDDMTVSRYVDTEAPIYSSDSIVWKSSSDAALDVESHPRQQRGSATGSCGSDQAPDADGRRLSEREMATSESSDVVLSSDCSLSSEQSPVRQTELTEPQSTDHSAAAAAAAASDHADPAPVGHNEVVSSENVTVATGSCVCESENVLSDETERLHARNGSLLDEIDSHLKRTHDRQLLLGSVTGMSSSAKLSPDDMSLVDVDTALAEVMSGLQLLGRSRGLSLDHDCVQAKRQSAAALSPTSSSPPGQVASPHTPDLVVGLPQFAVGAQSAVSPRPLEVAGSPPMAAGQLTSAEMFASVDSCTLKKSAPSASSAEIWMSSRPPLRGVDSPASVDGGGMMSAVEPPSWSPVRTLGDAGGGGARTRGSPARSQSCRVADRQSDQTWSTLWTASTEIQRDREFVRAVAPQFAAARHPLSSGPSSPGRDDGVSFDHTELPRFPSSASARIAGPRKDPPAASLSYGFVATLPREAAGGPRTPVKVKPPVMKKPVRSAEMMRRLSEYQHLPPQQQQQQQLSDGLTDWL